jgi:hypothetical protein
MNDCVAIMLAVWAETSMCCPRPSRWRAASATSAATAASAPACRFAWGTDTRTGARSSSPVRFKAPEDAQTVRSDAAHADFGPSCPNGVIDTMIRPGWRSERDEYPSPSESRYPGANDSMRKSASSTRLSNAARPSADVISSETLRLFREYDHQVSECSASGSSWRKGPSCRRGEPDSGSTAITSAPRSASIAPQTAEWFVLRSRTR